MSSNAVKRLSFALSTAAKNLVFEALSGNSKVGVNEIILEEYQRYLRIRTRKGLKR